MQAEGVATGVKIGADVWTGETSSSLIAVGAAPWSRVGCATGSSTTAVG